MNTGAPQGYVLSPVLYTLFTRDCVAMHTNNVIMKCADDTTIIGLIINNDETTYRIDDTTVIGLITNNDETTYRTEVSELVTWCEANNLTLNTSKAKEMVVDMRSRAGRYGLKNISRYFWYLLQ